MGTTDTASNKAQDLKGEAKEAIGKVTGDEKLQRKGKVDQAKAAVKDLGEATKDAVSTLKDTVTK